jgi:hypothetical protein
MKQTIISLVCIACILFTSAAFAAEVPASAPTVVLGTSELKPSACPLPEGATNIIRLPFEEFETIDLSCPSGSSIKITCAHFGRPDLTLECASHPLLAASCAEWGLKDGPCVANPDELLQRTQDACDGKSACSFQGNYKVAGHPSTNCDYNPISDDIAICFWLGEVCPHQAKNAVVSYECVGGAAATKVADAAGSGAAVPSVAVAAMFFAAVGGLLVV